MSRFWIISIILDIIHIMIQYSKSGEGTVGEEGAVVVLVQLRAPDYHPHLHPPKPPAVVCVELVKQRPFIICTTDRPLSERNDGDARGIRQKSII